MTLATSPFLNRPCRSLAEAMAERCSECDFGRVACDECHAPMMDGGRKSRCQRCKGNRLVPCPTCGGTGRKPVKDADHA